MHASIYDTKVRLAIFQQIIIKKLQIKNVSSSNLYFYFCKNNSLSNTIQENIE